MRITRVGDELGKAGDEKRMFVRGKRIPTK